jgi:hypothetical protein
MPLILFLKSRLVTKSEQDSFVRREQILACADAENFERAIHKLVAELKTVTLAFVMLDCGTFPRGMRSTQRSSASA